LRDDDRIIAEHVEGGGEAAANAASAIPKDGRVLFYRRDRAAFGFLSHFHPSPFIIDGIAWPTVEHYYQAQKSLDPRYAAAIRACKTPALAKRLASVPSAGEDAHRSWFNARSRAFRPDWHEVKADVMRRADAAKYAQNPDLALRLAATGSAEIVEDSKHDAYWGLGRDGSGANWAGRIIMEVRAALLAEGPPQHPMARPSPAQSGGDGLG
jgi:ribA/ribD-fused uncharacterized protein